MNIITICVIIEIAFCPNQAPRSWTERAYPKLIHYNKLDKGGHFAAWEQPELLVGELRLAFKTLRGDKATALNH